MTRYLLDSGAFIDIVNRSHETPLYYAFNTGNAAVVQYLLESGANVNAVSSRLTNALMVATLRGFLVSIQALVEDEANVQMRDMDHETALYYATKSRSLDKIVFYLREPLVTILSTSNKDEDTVLTLVFRYGAADLLTSLLNLASSPDAYEPDQSNVLTAALQNVDISIAIIKKLIRCLPQDLLPRILDHQTRRGTPLNFARISVAPQLQLESIEKLLKVLEGKVDALDLLFAGELATEYYKETKDSYECLKMTEPYLDALAHKHPSLKILEIGAGTGSSTVSVLETLLQDGEHETGRPKYKTYTFTDVSAGFL